MPSSSSSGGGTSSGSSGSAITIDADVRVGNNDISGGDYEYSLGVPGAGDTVTGQKTWDSDLSDGLDSGWVDVGLTITAQANAGSASLSVAGGNSALIYNTPRFRYISGVQITASVGGQNRRMSWSSLTVQFYKNGELTQTVTVDGPVADTISSGVNSASASVSPQASDNDKVVITALVRLESTATSLPPADGIRGLLAVSAS